MDNHNDKYIPPYSRQRSSNDTLEQEVIIELIPLLHLLVNSHKPLSAVMETRRNKYGVSNYGEIKGFLNPSDGDLWDVFVPGYVNPLSYGKEFVIEGLYGILMTPNGNHKIAIKLQDKTGFDESRVRSDIDLFKKRYTKSHKFHCRWYSADGVDTLVNTLHSLFNSYNNNGGWGERRKNIFVTNEVIC